jgi:hypothetical protein
MLKRLCKKSKKFLKLLSLYTSSAGYDGKVRKSISISGINTLPVSQFLRNGNQQELQKEISLRKKKLSDSSQQLLSSRMQLS